QEQLFSMHVGADALLDPTMRLTGTARDSVEWNSLPPTFYYESLFRQKPEANVLATLRLFNNVTREPMILSEHLNAIKTMAILTYGIWRWRLLGKGSSDVLSRNGGTVDVFTTFINNTLQWLTAKEDEKQVHVRPVKQIFTPNENVEFVGQAYDAKLSPVDNATVDVKITNGQTSYSLSLMPNGNGQYLGALSGLAQGDYTYQGKVTLGDKTLGEENGKFSVTDEGIEFQNTRMDAGLLRAVALKTGAKFAMPEQAAGLFDSVAAKKSFVPLNIEHKKEFELWTNVWMLSAALVCLCVEWFLRKRSGLL
ncbi:MAG TPA: hypothetical protein VFA55_00535, partial [Candidatus Kapabacteria bacterium]|nr:hypothetical protein [Candidatus Kapabacteria bacterium]